MLDELVREVDRHLSAVKANKSVKVNAQSLRNATIELGRRYFQSYRPFVIANIPRADLVIYDSTWQDIVRLAQGFNSKTRYLERLRTLQKQTQELRLLAITGSATPARAELDGSEQAIVTTLERTSPKSAASYRQAVCDLRSQPPRLSYRG